MQGQVSTESFGSLGLYIFRYEWAFLILLLWWFSGPPDENSGPWGIAGSAYGHDVLSDCDVLAYICEVMMHLSVNPSW